ncbi:response regulator [Verrucomicrobium sp. BvORR034]|jgi:CheY-like chemotaxis protein|uniref:response regulator n=1 Tax=Verrucomicrobium sp. BvORR034 TaxID=1396418 RepID=UPI000679E28E|nr:response regulator [Verrucomicrobium sp. BvORR034]
MSLAAPIPENPEPQATMPAFRGRILLVDDEPVLRALASTILTSHRWEVLSASSAEEAAQILRYCVLHHTKIDLLILDLVLPGGMSGMEALEALRIIQPGIPVIACSGFFVDEESIASCRRMGFDDVLPKPYTPRALAEMVLRILPNAVLPFQ